MPPQIQAYAANLAEEMKHIYASDFVEAADMFSSEAFMYAMPAYQLLGHGWTAEVNIKVTKAELDPNGAIAASFTGRFEKLEQLEKAIRVRLQEVEERWQGSFL